MPNQSGVIERIERTDLPNVLWLMVLGLVEGTAIKYIGSASGTIEIKIYGMSLALREDSAAHFIIRELHE